MYSFETHVASPVGNLLKAATAFDKAGSTLRLRISAAFVAVLAASHDQSVKSASQYLADKVPGVKVGSLNVYRSHTVFFLNRPGAVADIRRVISNPENMTPEAFSAACDTYAKGMDVRGVYDAHLAAKKAEKAAAIPKGNAADAEPAADGEGEAQEAPSVILNPDFNPVLSAQTAASRAIADLAACAGNGVEGAREALETLAAALAAALATGERVDIAA